MRITEIHVDGYGIWRDLHLGGVHGAITVISGRNEAGKSTLMQFLRDMFFDLPSGRQRYLPPVDDGIAGGHLGLQSATACWQLDREWRRTNGQWVSPARWHRRRDDRWAVSGPPPELEHVDRPLFENVFCLGLADLAALDQLDAATAGELLYSLSTGLDRVTLREITQRLQREQRELVDAESGRLPAMWRQYERERAAETEAASGGEEWLAVTQELAECERTLAQFDAQRDDLEREAKELRLAARTATAWHALWELQRQRDESPLGSGEDRDRFVNCMRLDRAARRCRKKYSRHHRRFAELKQKLEGLVLNDALWSQRRNIESLVDQQPRLIWLQARRTAEPPTAAVAQSPATQTDDGLAPELWSLLQQQAVELENARSECERLETLVVEAPADAPVGSSDDARLQAELREAGDRVTTLRRRMQLKQRLEKMVRHRNELQEETETLLEQQVLPAHVLAYLGIPFVVGVMLILGGLFWSTASKLGWPVALLGLAGWVAAVVIKVVLERSSAQELEEAQEQLEGLQRQIDAARTEAAELDEQIPVSSAPLDERLKQAERQLETLEKQLPSAASQLPTAGLSAQLEAAEARRERAERQWRQTLARCGLPGHFSPEKAAELPVRTVSVAAPVIHVPAPSTDDATRHEYELLAGRIRRLATELLPQVAATDPLSLLDQLHQAWLTERRRRFRRRRWLQQARQIRHKAFAARRRLRRLRRRLSRLRAGFEHLTTSQRLTLSQLWEKHRELEAQCQTQETRLRESLGDPAMWDAVAQWVRGRTEAELDEMARQARQKLNRSEQTKASLYETRGILRERQRQLAAEPKTDHCRRQRSATQQSLTELVARYHALATSQRHLNALQRRYEHERQPETLRDASRYFHFLTQRQYDRIWTPWDEPCLLVETARGDHRAIEQLSTGTRELLFLALRLAIVAHYARHGVRLPLILDDVLVNLDRQRCQAACRLLAAFSEEGHQVLFFTCHEHIVEALRDVGASVVSLPAADAPLEISGGDSTAHVLPAPSRAPAVAMSPAGSEPGDCDPVNDGEATEEEWEEEEWEEEWDEENELEPDEHVDEEAWEEQVDEPVLEEDEEPREEGELEEAYEYEYEYEYEDEDEDEDEEDVVEVEVDDEDGSEQPDPIVAADEVEVEDRPEGDVDRRGAENGESGWNNRFTWDSPERWSRGDEEAA